MNQSSIFQVHRNTQKILERKNPGLSEGLKWQVPEICKYTNIKCMKMISGDGASWRLVVLKAIEQNLNKSVNKLTGKTQLDALSRLQQA